MNFFKTAFFDAEEPSPSRNSEENVAEEHEETPEQENSVSGGQDSKVWNFGGFVKALTSKSEEVIEAYKRDLEEFKSGLKKETEVIKEVASRAVKDLPNSLEVGASVAQESLESVGQAIDVFGSSVWRGTSEIIAEGKEIISKLDEENNNNNNNNEQLESLPSSSVYNVQKYSRFEAQVRAMQLDSNTYCREPEDVEDFEAWKKEFSLVEMEEEIEGLCRENAFMEEVRARLVPRIVDNENFWMRYFYRLHRLKLAEEARVHLVKRAMISQEDEEDLSWEVDDDEEEIGVKEEKDNTVVEISKELGEKSKIMEKTELGGSSAELLPKTVQIVAAAQENVARPLQIAEDVAEKQEIPDEMVEASKSGDNVNEKPKDGDILVGKEKDVEDENDEKSKADEEELDETFMEAKTDPAESSKSSDFSVVSSKPSSHDEDDLGWDEIEDLSAVDERKLSAGGSPHRADIRKRISAVEDDEDLSWDVDDDDDDVKS